MLTGSLRKSRMLAQQRSLLLCIRRSELQEVLGEEYMELFQLHAFDHEDLQHRMIQFVSDREDASACVPKPLRFYQEESIL